MSVLLASTSPVREAGIVARLRITLEVLKDEGEELR